MEQKPPIPPKNRQMPENAENKLEEQPVVVEQAPEVQTPELKKPEPKEEKDPKEGKEQKKEKKEKDNKPKKEKKSNKKFKINKKVVLWVSIAVAVVALIVVAIIVFSPKYEKMQTPTVTVYSLSNQTIVYVEENKDAVRYDFCIQKQGENSITYLSSNTNSISIVSKLKTPGKYLIWARYAGQNRQQNSDESEKYVYTYTKPLNAPNVNQTATKLLWEKDSEAKEYRVYYGADEEGALYFVVNQPASSFSNVEFNLNTLGNLPAGRYSLHVQAIASTSSYYTDSDLGTEITYNNIKKLGNILTATFNKTTNLLTFTVDPTAVFVTKFAIDINGGLVSGQLVADQVKASYTFDLTPYITTNVTDLKIKAIGENAYIVDSEYKVCEITQS